MRKLITIFMLLCGFISIMQASDKCEQKHLSPSEFRAKQRAFITTQAGLTKEEAAKFFPVYFELQEEKKKLNDDSWSMIHKGKEKNVSEAQYEEIIERVYDNRIAADRLDKSYLSKFKKILSNKKIYLVRRAEIRFSRELVRSMQHNKDRKR